MPLFPQLEVDVHLTHQLILARELLALSADDLALRVDAEIASNPALDWVSPTARRPMPASSNRGDDEHATDRLPASPSLEEYLLDQLRLQIAAQDVPIGLELIGSLDRRGWLSETAEAVAERLDAPAERVFAVLRVLQSLDPPGIGARNAREALLLQLDQLDSAPPARVALARRLIAERLDDLAGQAWARLARALGVSVTEIEATAAFIRDNLIPYPAYTYWGDETEGVTPEPDVMITLNRDHPAEPPSVTVVEAERYALRIAPSASRTASSLPEMGIHLQRARLFLASLRQRWRTLAQVTTALVAAQPDYVRAGRPQARRVLTQTDLALALEVHPSTISRTVRDKYAQLPGGRIVALAAFFTVDAPAKSALQALVASEVKPLTDHALCMALAQQGFQLSRRTVAHYRAELGIASTHHRTARVR
ncbi:MAG: hypothetical protein KIT87_11555 [Anaerolineae bacterium]|nr:hypothetical protein [Anaerolineae bacterium]